MKSTTLLIALVGAGSVLAKPFTLYTGDLGQQIVLDADQDHFALGIDLDLNERRLVQLEGQEPVWMTEFEKIETRAKGIKFFDITETQDLGSLAHLKASRTVPPQITDAKEEITKVIDTLTTDGPRANLEKFCGFNSRYYRSETGKESQKWLLSKIEEITAESASASLRDLITINEFPHSWPQSSITVRINGSSDDDRIIIIGAHQDSYNFFPFLPAPGADDDGSGSVTILESFRALIASDFRPVRPVEFHWYAAEEGGLLGSQAVAQDYERRGANVVAMSQFDMTAWVKAGTREEVGIITDYVDKDYTDFNKQLVDTYLTLPYAETECGYACSDHASWSKAGYPGTFTIESQFSNSNQHIHSTSDRIDISSEFSFSHMLEFSKLAVAFVMELGGAKEL